MGRGPQQLRSVMEGLAKQYKQKDDEAQKVQRELS